MFSFWAKWSLRVQAGVAVLVPTLAIALFSSLYFPARLNEQGRLALERQAVTVGLLAVNNAAPTMRLIHEGLATPGELNGLFEGVRAGGDVSTLAALSVDEKAVKQVDGHAMVTVTANDTHLVHGALLPGDFELPEAGHCLVLRGRELAVHCAARDQDTLALLVVRFSLASFAQLQRENQVLGLWVLLVALGVGLLLALVMSSAIAGPLGVVTRVARELAAGDVSVPAVEVGGAREVQSMATSVNEMLGSLKSLVTQMVSLTGRLADASKGLEGAAADQEHVTSLQSAYGQQIAATFEELSRTAQSITRSTEVVEQAAARTTQSVDQARAVVREMVQGMTEIRHESKEVADAITRLNGDLQQVGRIALVIKQVAERSDLLALNAALEGTKAGEVGRGFSVVAAEMRKLAENVGQSAKDIGRLVESVQQSGERAVSVSQQGVTATERGTQVAERAQTAFEQILELSRGTTEAAQQIAVATRQQKQSSEQAVAGARNIADLVKQGVDATGRTTRIAADLQQSVSALTEVTGRFKVDGATKPG
jgi:methyl-accepting chemotaxis protein